MFCSNFSLCTITRLLLAANMLELLKFYCVVKNNDFIFFVFKYCHRLGMQSYIFNSPGVILLWKICHLMLFCHCFVDKMYVEYVENV